MKVISTTEARGNLGLYLDNFNKNSEHVVVLGRRNEPEAIIIKFPTRYKTGMSDITNVNSYSTSFDFLAEEEDVYSVDDAIAKYE